MKSLQQRQETQKFWDFHRGELGPSQVGKSGALPRSALSQEPGSGHNYEAQTSFFLYLRLINCDTSIGPFFFFAFFW